MKDTIIQLKDSLFIAPCEESIFHLHNKIELVNQDSSAKLFFGLPIEYANILIPTLITLMVFGLGIFFQWRSKKKDRLSVLASFKTVVVEWSKLSGNTIATQYKLYQKFRAELISQDNISPITFTHEAFLVEKLDELNLKEFIDLMVINKKGDKKDNALILLNIVSNIHKLSNIEKEVLKKYSEFADYTTQLGENWNSNLKKLNEHITHLPYKASQFEIKSEIEFFSSLKKIYDDFNSCVTINTTTKTRVNELLKPMEQICLNFIQKSTKSSEAYLLLPTLTELMFIEYQWSSYKQSIVRYINYAEELTKSTYEMLSNNINELDRMKFKEWIKIQ